MLLRDRMQLEVVEQDNCSKLIRHGNNTHTYNIEIYVSKLANNTESHALFVWRQLFLIKVNFLREHFNVNNVFSQHIDSICRVKIHDAVLIEQA